MINPISRVSSTRTGALIPEKAVPFDDRGHRCNCLGLTDQLVNLRRREGRARPRRHDYAGTPPRPGTVRIRILIDGSDRVVLSERQNFLERRGREKWLGRWPAASPAL